MSTETQTYIIFSFHNQKENLNIQTSYHGSCFQVFQFKENTGQSNKTYERLFLIFASEGL